MITLVSAVRALGQRGDQCDVAWPYGALKKCFKSRYVRNVHDTSDLNAEPDRFAADVLRLCQENNFDVLMPVSIQSMRALNSYKSDLEQHVSMLWPTADQLEIGANKSRTYRFCQDNDIAYPVTWKLKNTKDIEYVTSRTEFPIVLKHIDNLGGSRGVRFAGNEKELRSAYEYLCNIGTSGVPILAQEYVPGHLFDAVTVAKDGDCTQVFTSARKLMYPVSGGVTCISISTRSPELRAIARNLVRSLNWTGPIEMEFKLDPRDGKFKLIEINPRFWASLDSAMYCGINFPAIAVDLAQGRQPHIYSERPPGARHKYLIGRIPYAYWQLLSLKGYGAIRDPQKYTQTTNDIDLHDFMPDIFSALLVMRDLTMGKFPKSLSDGAKQMITPMSAEVPYD